MDGKTILQLADELGVSKQAIQKRISREPLCTSLSPYISTIKGTKYIGKIGESLIKLTFKNGTTDAHVDTGIDTSNGVSTCRTHLDELISILKKELESKDKQIEGLTSSVRELTAALENTTASLHAAQALHAGTMQKQITDGQKDDATSTVEPPVFEQMPEQSKKSFFSRLFKKERTAL